MTIKRLYCSEGWRSSSEPQNLSSRSRHPGIGSSPGGVTPEQQPMYSPIVEKNLTLTHPESYPYLWWPHQLPMPVLESVGISSSQTKHLLKTSNSTGLTLLEQEAKHWLSTHVGLNKGRDWTSGMMNYAVKNRTPNGFLLCQVRLDFRVLEYQSSGPWCKKGKRDDAASAYVLCPL